MNFNLRNIVETIGVLSVVFSLVFVGYELRLNRSVAGIEAFGVSTDTQNGFTALLAENAGVLSKGCIGEELSLEEELIFSHLVWTIDRFYAFRGARSQFGFTGSTIEPFARSVALNRYIFNGFNRKWIEVASFKGMEYSSPDWYKMVEEIYIGLNTQFVNNQYPSMCGL